jgi:hypothetical protein
MSKGERREESCELERVTVRSEEMVIYTHSRNLTVQIYIGTTNVGLGTSDVYRKHSLC